MRTGRMTSNVPGALTSRPSAGNAVAVTAGACCPTVVSAEPDSSSDAAQHPAVGTNAGEGRTLRRQLQPDRRIVRELNRLERMSPGGRGLVMQIQAPGRGERTFSHDAEFGADPRLGVFRKRNLAPHHMQHGRLAPAEAVAEVQRKRPVVGELRTRLGLDGGTGFRLTMDTGGEPIGALPFQRAVDRHRAIDAVAAAVERDARRIARRSRRCRNWR